MIRGQDSLLADVLNGKLNNKNKAIRRLKLFNDRSYCYAKYIKLVSEFVIYR